MSRNRIKELREERGLSTYQLAELVGTSQPQIHRLENKDPRLLKQGWIERLAKALKIPHSQIIGEQSQALSGISRSLWDRVNRTAIEAACGKKTADDVLDALAEKTNAFFWPDVQKGEIPSNDAIQRMARIMLDDIIKDK